MKLEGFRLAPEHGKAHLSIRSVREVAIIGQDCR
jgi:hypothetical protein